MSIIPNAYLRNERLASAQLQAVASDAKERAEFAVSQAKTALRLIVELTASHINREIGYVPDRQAVQRATITDDDMNSTAELLGQYLDDLLFQPMQLLSREAGEE